MNTELTTTNQEAAGAGLMIYANDEKDARYRLGAYVGWLAQTGGNWHDPDLAAYRDHLLATLAPETVRGHLSTIRSRYADVLRNNRPILWDMAAQVVGTGSIADIKATLDEKVTRIENALHPKAAAVKVTTKQDQADGAHLRLTKGQAEALMAAPNIQTLMGLRDLAVIALMLCTGIREAELSALRVDDLRQEMGGALALLVRDGKGAKQRLIPYGELDWALVIVDRWLEAAGIQDKNAPVFRGMFKGGYKLRPGQLSVRAIQYILAGYPITIDGHPATVKPHDLRRTYARRLYGAGMAIVAIQQNLGHADHKTTLRYIGTLDADHRKPGALYQFKLARLEDAPRRLV